MEPHNLKEIRNRCFSIIHDLKGGRGKLVDTTGKDIRKPRGIVVDGVYRRHYGVEADEKHPRFYKDRLGHSFCPAHSPVHLDRFPPRAQEYSYFRRRSSDEFQSFSELSYPTTLTSQTEDRRTSSPESTWSTRIDDISHAGSRTPISEIENSQYTNIDCVNHNDHYRLQQAHRSSHQGPDKRKDFNTKTFDTSNAQVGSFQHRYAAAGIQVGYGLVRPGPGENVNTATDSSSKSIHSRVSRTRRSSSFGVYKSASDDSNSGSGFYPKFLEKVDVPFKNNSEEGGGSCFSFRGAASTVSPDRTDQERAASFAIDNRPDPDRPSDVQDTISESSTSCLSQVSAVYERTKSVPISDSQVFSSTELLYNSSENYEDTISWNSVSIELSDFETSLSWTNSALSDFSEDMIIRPRPSLKQDTKRVPPKPPPRQNVPAKCSEEDHWEVIERRPKVRRSRSLEIVCRKDDDSSPVCEGDNLRDSFNMDTGDSGYFSVRDCTTGATSDHDIQKAEDDDGRCLTDNGPFWHECSTILEEEEDFDTAGNTTLYDSKDHVEDYGRTFFSFSRRASSSGNYNELDNKFKTPGHCGNTSIAASAPNLSGQPGDTMKSRHDRRGNSLRENILHRVNDIPENRRPSDGGHVDPPSPLQRRNAGSADDIQYSSTESIGSAVCKPDQTRSCVNLQGQYKDTGQTVPKYEGRSTRNYLSPDDAFNYFSPDEGSQSVENVSLGYDDYELTEEEDFRPRASTQPGKEDHDKPNIIERFKMSYRTKALSSSDVSTVGNTPAVSSPLRQRKQAYITGALPNKMKISDIRKDMDDDAQPSEFDIVGQRHNSRYPWQRDIGIQCSFCGTSSAYGVNENGYRVSPHESFTYSDTAFSDSQPSTPTVKPRVRKRRKGILSLTRPKSVGSTDDLEHEPDSFKQERKPSKFDMKGQRPHSVHLPSERSEELANSNLKRGTRSFSETLDYSRNSPRHARRKVSEEDWELDEMLNGDDDDDDQNQKRRSTESSPPESPHSRRRSRNSRLKLRHHNSDPTAEFLGVEDEFTGHEVLSSPRVSPVPWMQVPELVITQTQDNQRKRSSATGSGEQNLLRVPRQVQDVDIDFDAETEQKIVASTLTRRASIGSIHSTSEDSDDEPSPPVARRGRRAAIFESKTFGDVSPTSVSPEVSPANSCDESEDSQGTVPSRLTRRRSSVDLGMQVYPGDLLMQEHHKKILTKRNTIADFASTKTLHGSTVSLSSDQNDSRKVKNSFSFLKLIDKKSRSKECLAELEESLGKLKSSEFKDNHLASYKDVHWSDLIASRDKQGEPTIISETERKRREAVWELFKSELVFLIDHLMVLKHCFMEPMKQLQVDGHLMYAEPQDLLGNLDELCYVSYTFCRDFISLLLKDMSPSNFGSTSVLVKAFKRFAQHSKNGEVYHTYCLNYTNALNYLEQMRKNDDFCEFEKFCEQDARCKRLQLTDLLVAPMQHCTKLPLLLANIRKYTLDHDERQQLSESLAKTESYLKSLEEKMRWLKNFERVQEIQQQLVWQPIHEMDPRVYIPEFLKHTLGRQPCERLLASPKRQLIHEGQLMMMESSKPTDVFVFLFDDILLLTKTKGSKPTRKKSSIAAPQGDNLTPSGTNKVQTDQSLIVYKQPIALDRFTIHDVGHHEASVNGLKHAFVLVQISRFQQIIGVYTLQAATESIKVLWLQHLREAKESYKEKMLQAQQDGDSGKNKKRSPRMLLKHLNLHPHLHHLQHQHKKSASISHSCHEPIPSPPTPKNASPSSSSSPDEVRAVNRIEENGEKTQQLKTPTKKTPSQSPSPTKQDTVPMQSTPPQTPPMNSPLMSPLPLQVTHSLEVDTTLEDQDTVPHRPRPPRLHHLKNCHVKSKSIDTVYL